MEVFVYSMTAMLLMIAFRPQMRWVIFGQSSFSAAYFLMGVYTILAVANFFIAQKSMAIVILLTFGIYSLRGTLIMMISSQFFEKENEAWMKVVIIPTMISLLFSSLAIGILFGNLVLPDFKG